MEKERQELMEFAAKYYPGYYPVEWRDNGVYLYDGINFAGVLKKGQAIIGVKLLKFLDDE